MTMLDHFATFAGYNQWANRRLYAAVARLTDAHYREDRGVFFRSLHGTLNHVLGTDRIWMRRFTGEGDAPATLDAILFDDFDALRAAREAEDQRIIDHIAGLSPDNIAGTLRYTRVTSPDVIEQPRSVLLAHLFNHQTHHRGQAHAILTGLGSEAPVLDLAYFVVERTAQ